MGRCLLPLIVLVACGDRKSAPDKKPAPMPVVAARAADAAPAGEPAPEPTLPPVEVLSGAAAERAIAAEPGPPATAGPPVIGPTGVGPYRLGLARGALLALGKARVTRIGTDPTVERVEVPGMTLRVLAGRLVAITVTGRTARTDAGIGVGSTLAEAVDAHGEARPSGAGVVLADLPGVVFVVDGGAVERVVVVGPESD